MAATSPAVEARRTIGSHVKAVTQARNAATRPKAEIPVSVVTVVSHSHSRFAHLGIRTAMPLPPAQIPRESRPNRAAQKGLRLHKNPARDQPARRLLVQSHSARKHLFV